ncbi:MAG: potassium channel family protein [Nitrosomonas sp.]|uniref:potassium channel family protein n=1 Tax=Nitrosomonas sp. TaxID=42353 RepID=UPI0025F0CE9A|nr:potassium channel family protein [Nitrosomonas sp.]MBY0474386.1 potassium channel family protein [Nitrosomonas sp.]
MNEHASYLLGLVISGAVVTVCVILHYEALRFLSRTIGVHVHKRIGVLIVMLGLLVAHVLEIVIFALGYMLMQHSPDMGHITGMDKGNLFDFIYYSSVVYTTVGFGDLLPVGAIRMLSAAEGLAGLAMITWSASFTFLAMQRLWPHLLSRSEKDSND